MTDDQRGVVYENGFVLTCDAEWTVHPAGSVVVRDGRIAWVGACADLPAQFAADERIDVSGHVLLPGLVNCHSHAGLSVHRGACDEGDLFAWAATIAGQTSTLTTADIERGCQEAVEAMLAAGVTCACDCTRYEASLFSQVASAAGLRSVSGALANSPELRRNGRPNWPESRDEIVRAMSAGGENDLVRYFLGVHSPYSCTDDLVREVAAEARERKLPFVIHLAETKREVDELASRTGLTPARWLDGLGGLSESTLLVHGVWLEEADLDLVAERGASLAHCPTSNAKLASGIAPVRQVLERGIPLGLGTDSMLSNNAQDVMAEAKQASLLQRVRHGEPDFLSTREVLQMATLGGARALGWDDEIGSLEVGKAADVVGFRIGHPNGLTTERVMSDLVYATSPADVAFTMVNGVIRYGAACRS